MKMRLAVKVTEAEMRSAADRAIDPLIAEFEQQEAKEEQVCLDAWRRLGELLSR